MKPIVSLLALACPLACQIGIAQSASPADDWKAAITNQRGKQYPQVNSEGRVRFRIVAPEARNVTVSFRDSSPFTQGEDGAWIGYTRPLDEGFHSPQTAHEWLSWRRSLLQIAPLLFKD